jgi:hypothetical protein
MIDILLPRTDGGVIFQLVLISTVAAGVLWRIRHINEARILVIGV